MSSRRCRARAARARRGRVWCARWRATGARSRSSTTRAETSRGCTTRRGARSRSSTTARGGWSATKLPHPTEKDAWQVHTRYAYDAAGDLVQATDPLGHSWRFAYKGHLLVQETNRNGLSFYFAYDGYGEDAYCVRTWGDGGIYDHVIDYDKIGKVTCVTNSLGRTTTYKMNPVGCVVKVIDPLGGETAYAYDERTLWKVKETDALGGETQWAHDARGNVTKVTGPDGAVIAIDYDAHNQPVRAVDALGGEWSWGYDDRGRLIGRMDSLGRRVQFHWRADGDGRDEAARLKRLASLTDPVWAGHRPAL